MRNKGVLLLVELTVMLAVFALAAVLCLRAFLWADAASKEMAERDRAMILAQNAAEVLKNCSGDGATAARRYGGAWEDGVWTLHYDAQWGQVSSPSRYLLTLSLEGDAQPFLGLAQVCVTQTASDFVLWEQQIAWQEVTADE